MSNIVLIRLTHKGLACWHYVDIPKIKMPLYKKLKKGDDIELDRLGKILESGWGKNPPKNIAKKYS